MAITTARRSLRLRVSPPVGQALAVNLLENGGGALFVGEATPLPLAEGKVLFGAVEMKGSS